MYRTTFGFIENSSNKNRLGTLLYYYYYYEYCTVAFEYSNRILLSTMTYCTGKLVYCIILLLSLIHI